MVTNVQSMGLLGLDPFIVSVESDISKGLPTFEIVGLPDASVKESKDRVRSAINNSGFGLSVRRIVINLVCFNEHLTKKYNHISQCSRI